MRLSTHTRSSPRWLQDFGSRDHLALFPARIDPAQFQNAMGTRITVATDAAIGDTSIAVHPITGPILPFGSVAALSVPIIQRGEVVRFPSAGNPDVLAEVTDDVHVGATAIPVQALAVAVTAGTSVVYQRFDFLSVPSGTPVGRTYAERDGAADFGPADAADDEFYLLYHDIPDAWFNPDAEFVRSGAGIYVKENYLPGYEQMLSALAIDDPTATPVLTAGGAGAGQIPAGTYLVGYTQATDDGETALSPTASVTIPDRSIITVDSIALASGAVRVNYYMSQASGGPNLGFSVSGPGGAAQVLSSVGTFPLAPSQNTTGGTAGTLLTAIRAHYHCIRGEG